MTKDDFLAQYSGNTRRTYGEIFQAAEGFFGHAVESATVKEITQYHRSLSHQAPATVNLKLAALSSLYRYLIKTGMRGDNPAAVIRRVKIDPMRTVRWLTEDETSALLSVAKTPRDAALVWIALHGLRVAEIVALDAGQYDAGTLWNISGKGGRSRIVPLAAQARLAVEAYLQDRRSGPLFLTERGRLSRRTAQREIERLSTEAGNRINIHALRHTYGTRAVRKGVRTLTLMRLMGHVSAETTAKYVHLDPSDLQEANETVYPVPKPVVIQRETEAAQERYIGTRRGTES